MKFSTFAWMILFVFAHFLVSLSASASPLDIVAYAGGAGSQQFTDVHQLSDGTLLISGNATDLSFVPQIAKRIELNPSSINSAKSGRYGFILHLTGDLRRILQVVYLPKGVTADIRRIKSSEIPGQKTGDLYISGPRSAGERDLEGTQEGYFIAKLNGNFVEQTPTGLEWVANIAARGDHMHLQPWDVTADGKVYAAAGEPFNTSWSAVYRFNSQGKFDIVNHWRYHLTPQGPWHGEPASSRPEVQYSVISLKAIGRGSLRSWNMSEFVKLNPDGNGGLRQGTWPWDAFFGEAYDDAKPMQSSQGEGYLGAQVGKIDTGLVGGIVVDRRTQHVYMAIGLQTILPSKHANAEPAVLAFDPEGRLLWWNRLHEEKKAERGSQQFVDALAIDYSQPAQPGSLVVCARAFGKNNANFWRVDQIKAAGAPKRTFQTGWDGEEDKCFIGWLGRLNLSDGVIRNATYLGEYAEGMQPYDGTKAYSDPNLDGWLDHDLDQSDLANTRLRPALKVDGKGRVYVLGMGRRVITTASAYQKMLKPREGTSSWSEFVRVYAPDFSTLVYSSLITGQWDPTTGQGGNNTALFDQIPLEEGVLVVGTHTVDHEGIVEGQPIRTQQIPPWGRKTPAGQEAILAKLHFQPEASAPSTGADASKPSK